MSLSLRDQYLAVLTPDRVALVRRRAWRGSYDLKLDAPCAGPQPPDVVQALAGLLQRPEVGRGEATLLVSNHFVRYLLVPWRDEVGCPGELAAFADICWDRVYGGESTGRVLRTAPEKASSARLAAGMDRDFLDALEKTVADSPLQLHSVQPYLAAAYNRLGREFRHRDFLFVLAEPERTCLLAARGGSWLSVRTGSGEDSPEALAERIDRETRLLGLEEETMPPIYVHAPRRARLELPPCNGVSPRALALPIPAALAEAADPLLTMAMAVA